MGDVLLSLRSKKWISHTLEVAKIKPAPGGMKLELHIEKRLMSSPTWNRSFTHLSSGAFLKQSL